MSQAVIGNLRATLGLDSAQFEAGAKRAQKTLSNLKAALTGFASGIAATLSVEALVGGAIDALHEVAQIGDLAETIGVTAEQVQAFNSMALASGTSTDTMARGLQSITEQSTQAGSALGKLFSANGFDVKAMNAQQAIMTFMDLLQRARTPAEQLQMATSVLSDKVGRELVEAMRTGSAGFDAAMQSMVQSGIYHTNAEVARMQEIETRYNQVAANIKTIWQSMIVEIATGLDSLRTTYQDSVSKMGAADAKAALATAQAELAGLKADAETVTGRAKFAIDQKITELEARVRVLQMATDDTLRSAPGEGDRQFATGNNSVLPPEPVKAARKEIDETARALERLQAEGKRVWEDTRTPAEQYRLEIERLNGLLKAGVIDQETYNRAIAELRDEQPGATGAVEKYQKTVRELNGLLAAGAISQEDYNRAIAEAQSQFDGASKAAENLGETVGNQLGSTFESWIDSAIDGTFDLKEALASLAKDVAKMFIQNGLQGLFGGGSSGGGGLFGSLFGALFGGFAGLYAEGGRIPSGKWGIVGEGGAPEIVSGPGTVTPLKDLLQGTGHEADGLAGLRDSLDGMAQKMAESKLSGILTSLTKAMGSASGFGDSFAGLYADGGTIPAGKWGVVGEAGYPEIVAGPGTVTPMKDLAMGGGHQTVDVVLHPSKELWAEVDQKVAQGERRAVQVSVSESARQADRNFGGTYKNHQVRKF